MKKAFLLLMISTVIFAQTKKQTKNNCSTAINNNITRKPMDKIQKNVLGSDLILASTDPLTGFYRTGFCATDANDRGIHVVAAVVTDAFLRYSLSQGNDLITPNPANGFPGLKAGNIWCLCALRWKEALQAGVAPPVLLEATNSKALEYISIKDLKDNEAK